MMNFTKYCLVGSLLMLSIKLSTAAGTPLVVVLQQPDLNIDKEAENLVNAYVTNYFFKVEKTSEDQGTINYTVSRIDGKYICEIAVGTEEMKVDKMDCK